MFIILNSIIFYEIVVYEMEFLTIHVPKKGNAYLDGTVHVAKEVETIQRFLLEPYMWEKRYEPNTGTVHVAKCSFMSGQPRNVT